MLNSVEGRRCILLCPNVGRRTVGTPCRLRNRMTSWCIGRSTWDRLVVVVAVAVVAIVVVVVMAMVMMVVEKIIDAVVVLVVVVVEEWWLTLFKVKTCAVASVQV